MQDKENPSTLDNAGWFLRRIAEVIDTSPEIRDAFQTAGLNLINKTWSAYSDEARLFALEKAKYGNAAQTLHGRRLGYDSPWMNQILAENGLTNMDLLDVERSAACEARIDSDPRLAPYRRSALVPLSTAEVETQKRERRAESEAIGKERMLDELGLPTGMSIQHLTLRQTVECISLIFDALGLKSFKPEGKRYMAGFSNPGVTGPAAFYLKLDSLEFNHAFSCEIKLGVRHDLTTKIDGVSHLIKWDILTRSLRPMIEGFGRYTASTTKEDFLISLYATAKVVPFIVRPFLLK